MSVRALKWILKPFNPVWNLQFYIFFVPYDLEALAGPYGISFLDLERSVRDHLTIDKDSLLR